MWVRVVLAGGAVVGLVGYKKWFAPHVFGAIKRSHEQAAALVDVAALLQADRSLPTLGGWAISPDLARLLIEHVRDHKPNLVVEFGAGSSTVILGRALHHFHPQGRLVSIESEEEFARAASRLAKEWDLDADVRLAPLTGDWYQRSILHDLQAIDLLLIDGPAGVSRYPALPHLHDRLSENAVIVVDDAGRRADADNVERWARNFHLSVEWLPLEKGVAIMRRS